jgi:microcystin-dependent protein
MKTNKFKFLSIAICCLVSALLAKIQGMEEMNESAGVINSFAGEKAPNGWLICDGAQYSSREYPRLYKVIKTKYVPANERLRILQLNEDSNYKLFCVPDLRGRVIVGVDGGAGRVTSDNTLGAIGGEEKHKLTVDELASHNHEINLEDLRDFREGGSYIATYVGGRNKYSTVNTGGDKPHNNMQPYQVLNYIISTGEINRREEILSANTGIAEQLQRQISELNINVAKLHMKVANTFVPDPQACAKAWVVFDGSQNVRILDNYNVSSVIRDGVGIYRIKFSRPFSSQFYCSAFSSRLSYWGPVLLTALWPDGQTSESIKFITCILDNRDYADAGFVSACFYGR